MNKKWTKKDFVLGLVAFALCVLIFSIQSTKSLYEKRNSYLVPPQSIKYMTFGYEDVLADSLWIRLIQDFSTCDPSGKAGVQEYLRQDLRSEELDESLKDADSEKLYELYEEKWKAPKCHMSWVYYMLDRITDLSPKFDRAYRTGGLFLSIVLDDRVGGELFYDKALKDHPNNWQLAYHAGYHALYETRKFSKAADLFKLAADNGAPHWVYALAAKLHERTGRAELTVRYLTEVLENNPDINAERFRERLEMAKEVLRKTQNKTQ